MTSFFRFLPILLFSFLVSPLYASEVILESHVDKVKVAKLSMLPMGPNPDVPRNCERSVAINLTQNSRSIEKKGWIVTSQLKYGPFELISFSGSLDASSGICVIKQTNVAIFKFQNLKGIFYTDPDIDDSFGSIYIDQTGKIIAVPVNEIVRPSFEITFRKNKITLDSLSYNTACEGEGIIPDLNGEYFESARKTLLQYGWKPTLELSGSEDFLRYYHKDEFLEDKRIRSKIPELITCSGTGFGFCKYLYENDTSYLDLETVSDGNEVVSLVGFCK